MLFRRFYHRFLKSSATTLLALSINTQQLLWLYRPEFISAVQALKFPSYHLFSTRLAGFGCQVPHTQEPLGFIACCCHHHVFVSQVWQGLSGFWGGELLVVIFIIKSYTIAFEFK